MLFDFGWDEGRPGAAERGDSSTGPEAEGKEVPSARGRKIVSKQQAKETADLGIGVPGNGRCAIDAWSGVAYDFAGEILDKVSRSGSV